MSTPTEAQTRKDLIDPALEQAGWNVHDLAQVRTEIPVDGFDPQAWKTLKARLNRLREAGVPYEAELPRGVCDYALYQPNGETIAVVEARRTSVDPRLAVPQVEFYVTEIEKRQSFRPFAFMANGYDIRFWDVGRANERQAEPLFKMLLHRTQQGEP